MARVLLVEDDSSLARAVVNLLAGEGYAVDRVDDGEVALEIALSEPYSALILDIGLPKVSGLELLRSLRQRGSQIPVLMLTARDAIADRVRGLDDGADDYLTKPFSSDELLARLRAIIRRSAGEAAPTVIVGNLVCDPAAHSATVAGRRLELPRREWAVLHCLAANAGKVVLKERLAGQVFSFDDEVGSNALEVYIARLRKKLAPNGPSIKTLRGLGYILDA